MLLIGEKSTVGTWYIRGEKAGYKVDEKIDNEALGFQRMDYQQIRRKFQVCTWIIMRGRLHPLRCYS